MNKYRVQVSATGDTKPSSIVAFAENEYMAAVAAMMYAVEFGPRR
jgi:hypothetical protein